MTEGATKRASALDAALVELQQWGVDRFSIEGVTQRSGLDADYFRSTWPDERQLIVDTLLSYSESMIGVPDTGSLRGDLTELSLNIAAYLNEPVGRRLLRMLVVDNRSQAVDAASRAGFWRARLSAFDDVFRRARDRGELRDEVTSFTAVQLLLSPLHTMALYTDTPIDPEHCRATADLVVRAISR